MVTGNVEHIKHGQYVTEIKTNFSRYSQVVAPQVSVAGGRDLSGTGFSLGWSFITQPLLMVAEAHTHDFDQIVFILGGDPNNVGDFDGEVEMYLGSNQEKNIITYPAFVYIPKGLLHCPLNFKRVTRPMMWIDVTLSPGLSVRPLPASSRRKGDNAPA
jgi:hypothetical protein